MRLDLSELPAGGRYEDRYGRYLDVFHKVAMTPADEEVRVYRSPFCWVPLFHHLNCVIESPRIHFDHCAMVEGAISRAGYVLDRTAVEVLCGFRPETVDALWKIDWQWQLPKGRAQQSNEREFIVTTNGSFHRTEVKQWLDTLSDYTPRKRKVLLVPCAADKPYPSLLHKVCMELLPDDYYIATASGVTGIAPQDLWEVMPWYDSGIPYQWRLFEITREYFSQHHHLKVVVYLDFYSQTVYEAMRSIGRLGDAVFVNPVKKYDDYLDLMDADRLDNLRDLLNDNV